MGPEERVFRAVARAWPEGVTIADLRDALPDLGDNALRYRLRELVKADKLVKQGARRTMRYIAAREPEPELLSEPIQHHHERDGSGHVVFSTNALAALASLDLPSHARPVARYDKDWVASFARVSERGLFTPTQRAKLSELGNVGMSHAPAGTYARAVFERLLIDLSWASSHLEGNTYTLLDTHRLIARGIQAMGRDASEVQMILNHKRAIEFILEDALELGITRLVTSNLHAVLMENLLADTAALGALRRQEVRIGQSTYIPPRLPQVIREQFELVLTTARSLEDPFEQSLFLLAIVPYLQPFIDGNKRTARMLANIPLFTANLCPLSFIGVQREDYLRAVLHVYEHKDLGPLAELYVWAYERSAETLRGIGAGLVDPDPFRLQWRDAIYEAVARIVEACSRPAEPEVEALAHEHFDDPAERVLFVAMVLSDIEALHEGNFMRYRIRPSSFSRWQESRGYVSSDQDS